MQKINVRAISLVLISQTEDQHIDIETHHVLLWLQLHESVDSVQTSGDLSNFISLSDCEKVSMSTGVFVTWGGGGGGGAELHSILYYSISTIVPIYIHMFTMGPFYCLLVPYLWAIF